MAETVIRFEKTTPDVVTATTTDGNDAESEEQEVWLPSRGGDAAASLRFASRHVL